MHNEQIRLAATALNNLGIASVVTGVFVPLAAYGYGTARMDNGFFAAFVCLWMTAGLAGYLFGRLVLRSMR